MRNSVPLIRLARLPKSLAYRYHSTSTSTSKAAPVVADGTARLRFAPSPTGLLHLGGLRTALFNHLLARKWKGKWILRVEDTDRSRLFEGAVDNLRRTLDWAGLNYDEGVGVGGPSGPYTQSDRLDIYHEHSRQLLSTGQAYECFCSPDELLAIKQSMGKNSGKNYDGRCSHLTEEDVARQKKAGHKHVVRFKATPNVELPLDLIFGQVRGSGFGDDDFIIIKQDGYPTYHFASVIDDHLMEISHVLRGEEWLPSLRRHHQLYNAFKWQPPQFGHLPLLVNPDGSKLSKRTGDVSVESYREKGYEPDALLNFLALMGWDHHTARTPPEGSERNDGNSLSELFTMDELISDFDITHVNHRKAAVDISKLDFLNKMTLRRNAGRLGEDGNLHDQVVGHHESRQAMVERLQVILLENKSFADIPLVKDLSYVEKVLDADLARTTTLKELASNSSLFFCGPHYGSAESKGILKGIKLEKYIAVLEAFIPLFEERIANLSEELGQPLSINEDIVWETANQITSDLYLRARSEIMTPLRHALTAQKKGPSVPTIMVTLGVERSLNRLQKGLENAKQLLIQRNRPAEPDKSSEE